MALCIFLRSPNGNRHVLYLYYNGSQWDWNYNWLDNNWNDNNPSAVLASFFIYPLFILYEEAPAIRFELMVDDRSLTRRQVLFFTNHLDYKLVK